MNDQYDVIIGGSGIAGSSLSMILSKLNLDVLMLEAKSHPRFAIGEAMLPLSAVWMWIVGEYFDVPEIQYLSDANKVIDNVTTSCGVKHSVGFAYHEEDEPFRGEHAHQLVPPNMPFYKESHLVREHIDHYLVQAAEKYDVSYVDETPVTDVEITPDAALVRTPDRTVSGAVYIDATGGHSVLADKMGYRDETPNLETDTRAIFTHVEGLNPFDDQLAPEDQPGQTNRLHDGTLHHVFDGGWMWVIPFDNFERSEETKASVGLMLDRSKHPIDESVSPEDEFFEIIASYPDIATHLSTIDAIMPWIRTDRLQRSSSQSVGDRHILTNHTYGFVDPLYSQGLIHSFESIFKTANILRDAFSQEDFSASQFAPINDLHKRQIETADLLVRNGYRATTNFRLWNAWTQVILIESIFPDLYIQRFCLKYLNTGDTDAFDPLLHELRPGDEAPFTPEKDALLAVADRQLAAYATDEIDADAAADAIFSAMQQADWLPKHVYDWGNEAVRHVDFADPSIIEALIGWGYTAAPDHIQNGLFDFELPEIMT